MSTCRPERCLCRHAATPHQVSCMQVLRRLATPPPVQQTACLWTRSARMAVQVHQDDQAHNHTCRWLGSMPRVPERGEMLTLHAGVPACSTPGDNSPAVRGRGQAGTGGSSTSGTSGHSRCTLGVTTTQSWQRATALQCAVWCSQRSLMSRTLHGTPAASAAPDGVGCCTPAAR